MSDSRGAAHDVPGITLCGAGTEAAPDDAEVMAGIARLNAKQFRTMLRVAARGLHIEQATELLRLRGQTKLELLADDVNT